RLRGRASAPRGRHGRGRPPQRGPQRRVRPHPHGGHLLADAGESRGPAGGSYDGSMADSDDVRRTDSGITIEPLYTAADLAGWDPAEQLGDPGRAPSTRGIYPSMYRGRLWTMRQYAGFGSAETTNERFQFLLKAGQTGLSCAFDLPTQMGYDSDHPRAEGEVG